MKFHNCASKQIGKLICLLHKRKKIVLGNIDFWTKSDIPTIEVSVGQHNWLICLMLNEHLFPYEITER